MCTLGGNHEDNQMKSKDNMFTRSILKSMTFKKLAKADKPEDDDLIGTMKYKDNMRGLSR